MYFIYTGESTVALSRKLELEQSDLFVGWPASMQYLHLHGLRSTTHLHCFFPTRFSLTHHTVQIFFLRLRNRSRTTTKLLLSKMKADKYTVGERALRLKGQVVMAMACEVFCVFVSYSCLLVAQQLLVFR